MTSILCKNFINGNVEFLGVSDSLMTKGTYWIENLLCPNSRWGVGDTVEILNWGSQPGGCYGIVDIPWYGAVPACLPYLPRSLENLCATARSVRDDLLHDHLLVHVQILSNSRYILCDILVNKTDCAWYDLWDDPVDEYFVWRFQLVV